MSASHTPGGMQCVGMKQQRHTSIQDRDAARSSHLILTSLADVVYFGIKDNDTPVYVIHDAAESDRLILTVVAVAVQGQCSTLESRTQTRRHMPFMMQAATASTCWPMPPLKTSPPLLPSLR